MNKDVVQFEYLNLNVLLLTDHLINEVLLFKITVEYLNVNLSITTSILIELNPMKNL